jgi:thioredoxin
VIDATDATFEAEVVAAGIPVLVDFTAPWCRPCRAIEPFLVDLEREHEGCVRLVRVDIDENLAVPSRYGVLSLPTVMVFVDGVPVETIHGLQPRRRYVEAVERALDASS